ncbi:hypothetical protein PLICRDRAFT_50712 [Plicaturopsis crispa FD-325 SS-3]|nr:hypothetical protein PLICRDRAFT_50712 [Plicaturopsis crispa FD-325 SS-3]
MDDGLYDTAAAAAALRILSRERANANCNAQLGTFSKNAEGLSKSQIVASEQPLTWSLATQSNKDEDVEEIVLHTQGIIVNMDLPPIDKSKAMDVSARQRKYMKQSVSLTGFGEEGFHNSIDSVIAIHDTFSRQFKEGELEAWYPSTFKGHPTMEIANRYFTPCGHGGATLDIIPFPYTEDPQGTLQSLTGSALKHTAENSVSYYERVPTSNKMVEAAPYYFRVGDIVEAQISFKVVPLKGGKRKMLMVMRALAIMDRKHSKDASALRARSSIRPPILTMKRKIGYFDVDEEVGKTRAEIERMVV